MRVIMKKCKSLEDLSLLIKGVTQTIESKTKEPRDGFVSMVLGTREANPFGNGFTHKEVVATRQDIAGVVRAGRYSVIRSGERIHRARQEF